MSSRLGVESYDDEQGLYVVNHNDRTSDELDEHPAIRELQEASRAAILRGIQQPGASVVKVTPLGPPRDEVRGYVTLARFVAGASPEQLEKMLGFRPGILGSGCRIYTADVSTLRPEDIGPRCLTSWSAGVSPRDLQRLSDLHRAPVTYHRDYPAASDPIPQFVLFRPVRVLSSTILLRGERFAEP